MVLSALSWEGGLFSLLLGSRRWLPHFWWVRLLKRGAALSLWGVVSLSNFTLPEAGSCFCQQYSTYRNFPFPKHSCTQKWKQGDQIPAHP